MEASANSADSGVPATPSSRNGREVVSASLEGLVHAVDGLKTSMGYDDFNTVQSLINDLRQENEELRSYAEAAIRVRPRRAAMTPAWRGGSQSPWGPALHVGGLAGPISDASCCRAFRKPSC